MLEDILPDLARYRAKVFSKVDFSHGHWHCILQEDSSLPSPFLLHLDDTGGYAFPIELFVDSEILQKPLLQALQGLVRVACRADDILMYGVGDTLDEATREHGKTLTSLLKRCKEKSIRLN